MSLYVIINIAVLFFPFVLSFDKKVAFFKRWPPLLGATVIVSTIYIVWDHFVTEAGHWAFNPAYTGPPFIGELPLGEILFFITVPYACIFIYEVIKAYSEEKIYRIPAWAGLIPAFIFGAAFTVIPPGQDYTLYVSISTAAAILLMSLAGLLNSRHFLLFLGISYIPFLIVNGILTSVPVITYGEQFYSGIRIGTIPAEDFFYNFSFLCLTGAVYALLNRFYLKLRKEE